MDNIIDLPGKGNPSPIYRYFNEPLDRTEAQRATWFDYRVRLRELETDPTLDNEIKALAARAAWHAAWRAAWRAANENTDRGPT